MTDIIDIETSVALKAKREHITGSQISTGHVAAPLAVVSAVSSSKVQRIL